MVKSYGNDQEDGGLNLETEMGNNYQRRHGYTWTQQEVDSLRNKASKGISIKRIAQIHERSTFAITCAMEKWNIKWAHPKVIIDKQPTKDDKFVINGVDYDRKFNLASKIVESVINGDTKYVRLNDKIWSEVIP